MGWTLAQPSPIASEQAEANAASNDLIWTSNACAAEPIPLPCRQLSQRGDTWR
jgi:hypothetical protein